MTTTCDPKFYATTAVKPDDAKLVMEVYLQPEGIAVALTKDFRDALLEENPTILISAIIEAVKDTLGRATLRVQ
jgi:hypothetical protein